MIIAGFIIWCVLGLWLLAFFNDEVKYYKYPYNEKPENSDFAIVRKITPFVRRHPCISWVLFYILLGPVVWVMVIAGCIVVGIYMLMVADVVR